MEGKCESVKIRGRSVVCEKRVPVVLKEINVTPLKVKSWHVFCCLLKLEWPSCPQLMKVVPLALTSAFLNHRPPASFDVHERQRTNILNNTCSFETRLLLEAGSILTLLPFPQHYRPLGACFLFQQLKMFVNCLTDTRCEMVSYYIVKLLHFKLV